jgi:hypothetical protein
MEQTEKPKRVYPPRIKKLPHEKKKPGPERKAEEEIYRKVTITLPPGWYVDHFKSLGGSHWLKLQLEQDRMAIRDQERLLIRLAKEKLYQAQLDSGEIKAEEVIEEHQASVKEKPGRLKFVSRKL